MQVSPFRYLRINGYLLLPAAFRSLSRLSSALSAKASTLRFSSLNHLHHIALCAAVGLFFLSWLSYDLSIMMLLVISIRLASVPILGCLVDI